MFIEAAVKGLAYLVEHRKEIARDAEATIQFLRRVHLSCTHHNCTIDDYAKHAEDALHKIAEDKARS